MTVVDFKPSDIRPFARSLVPFVATFNHSESEVFAAMIVGALAMHDNEWGPITPRQIGMWLKMQVEEDRKTWEALFLARPHPHTLVKEGFCRFVGENPDDEGAPIEFTDAGLEALRKWVRP